MFAGFLGQFCSNPGINGGRYREPNRKMAAVKAEITEFFENIIWSRSVSAKRALLT
jgi:hypothetical protein